MHDRSTTHRPPSPGKAADAAAARLEVRAVSKRYGSVLALDDVSLTVRAGEVLGLCGHNGAGKSSLVRMLVGLTRPDAGEILVDGRPVSPRDPQDAQREGIAVVDQELSLVAQLPVRDNLFLGAVDQPLLLRRGAERAEARELLARVGLDRIDPDAPVASLTIGERQLVEIARLLGRHARVLILDEPTATLSESEIGRVFDVVRGVVREGRSVIYVSHRLNEVLDLCDRVCVLRDGRHVATHEIAELDHRRLVDLIVGEQGVTPAPRHAPRSFAGSPPLEIRDLVVPNRVDGVSLAVRAGEIVGLAGQVSSGASEVLRAVGGLVPAASGGVTVDGRPLHLGAVRRSVRAGVVYTSNDRQGEGLFLSQSNERNLLALRHDRISRAGLLSRGSIGALARKLAARIGLPAQRLRMTPAQLSGGNQQKVLLGRALDLAATRVLLFDDPTRGVDVGARAEIHALIRDAARTGTAVVVSSTEMEELMELSDRIVTFFGGRVVTDRPRGETDVGRVFAEMTLGAPAGDEEASARV